MDRTQVMVEMIERCRTLILNFKGLRPETPPPLRPNHLLWMCDRMTRNLEEWAATKLNRWIGFIQCAMIANSIIDLDGAKEMFDQAKTAFGEPSQDLLDHLDPGSDFEIDIGGQG